MMIIVIYYTKTLHFFGFNSINYQNEDLKNKIAEEFPFLLF